MIIGRNSDASDHHDHILPYPPFRKVLPYVNSLVLQMVPREAKPAVVPDTPQHASIRCHAA